MATITSTGEWKRIKSQLGGQMSGKYTWLGATDNKVEDSWEWVTGEPWGFEMWHPSEISATQQFYREDYMSITDLPADGIGGWYWASHNPEYRAANVPHDFYMLEKNRDGNGKDTACSCTINAWAQNGNPQFSPKQRRFYTHYSDAHFEAPVFTEGTWSSVMPNPSDPEPDNTDGVTSGMARIYIDRYDAMANNVAFMDGSVRGIMLNELWKPRWNARWVNPN